MEFSTTFGDFDPESWNPSVAEFERYFENEQQHRQPQEHIIETEEQPLDLLLQPFDPKKENEQLRGWLSDEQWVKDFLDLDEQDITNLPDVNDDLGESLDLTDTSTADFPLHEAGNSMDIEFSDPFSLTDVQDFEFSGLENMSSNEFNLDCFDISKFSFDNVDSLENARVNELKFDSTYFEDMDFLKKGFSDNADMTRPSHSTKQVPQLSLPPVTQPHPLLQSLPKLNTNPNRRPINAYPPRPVYFLPQPAPQPLNRNYGAILRRRPTADRTTPNPAPHNQPIVKVLDKKGSKYFVQYAVDEATGRRYRPEWLSKTHYGRIPERLVQEFHQRAWREMTAAIERMAQPDEKDGDRGKGRAKDRLRARAGRARRGAVVVVSP